MKRQRPKCGHFLLERTCIECAETYHFWQERLKESGFYDFEIEGEKINARINESDKISKTKQNDIFYYSEISAFAQKNKFNNDSYKRIMELRSEGFGISEILRKLLEENIKINRETIRYIIRRFEFKWGIRAWTLKEMNIKARTKSKRTWQKKYPKII